MPIIGNFKADGLIVESGEVKFTDMGLNKKAREDLCFLVNKSGLAYFNRLNHINITGPNAKVLAECLVMGVDANAKNIVCPATELTDSEELGMVVLVSYANDAVSGIYLFGYPEVKKGGMLSRFKYSKKDNAYTIKVKGLEKCINNKFGIVFSQYINR